MIPYARIWGRLPLALRGIVAGLALSFAGSTAAVIPLVLNLKFGRDFPWSLPLVLAVTYAFWRWTQGDWPPEKTRARRAYLSRADGGERFRSWVIPSLMVVLVLVLLRVVAPLFILVPPPSFKAGDLGLPPLTLAAGALAIAVSSGVVEEVAFRGYMQRPLEQRYGLSIAILITGVMFWVAHLPDVTIAHLPGQLAASALFGCLAVYTRSLVAPIVTHVAADIALQTAYALHQPEWIWKLLASPPVWQGSETSSDAISRTAAALNPFAQPVSGGLTIALFAAVVACIWSLRRLRLSGQEAELR